MYENTPVKMLSAGIYLALLLGIGEVAIYTCITGLTAYSAVEGAVRVSLTVSK